MAGGLPPQMAEKGVDVARPTKLTPERQQQIVSTISAGNHLVTAAGSAGISYYTFRLWMVRGENAIKTGSRRKSDRPFIEFFKACQQAENEAGGSSSDVVDLCLLS